MKRLVLIVVALLACGLIAAGCGDDDDDNGSDSPAAAETTPTDTTSEDLGSAEDAVEACKDGVEQTAGELSEDLRNDLEQLCEDAADGDEEEIREASIDICRRVAEEVVPEGSGRDQALEACESAGGP